MDGIISVTLDIILGIKMLELGRVTYLYISVWQPQVLHVK